MMIGPSLPLSLALSGFNPPGIIGVRGQIERAAALGFRAVTLNAAAADARPRDLGRSARRDLAALIRRHSMVSAGVDLWLPAEHLVQPAHSERALEALLDAVDFAAEMGELASGRAVLSTMLLPPEHEGMAAVLGVLRERAMSHGVMVADHRWPRRARVVGGAEGPPPVGDSEDAHGSPLGVGIDPAMMFMSDGPLADPGAAVSKHGARVVSARLSDANASGRCPIGPASLGGRLDVLAYAVALSTGGYRGWLAVDVRGLRDAESGARSAVAAIGKA
jgi:sugar phosphate isomerase/epimerase